MENESSQSATVNDSLNTELSVALTEKLSGLSEQRRRELGNFLRSRRQRLKPEIAGLDHGRRRRTPGLRREEVAERAGVGTTWYTWLEQARDIQASRDVLRRLAIALMLNPTETRHLFQLAGKAIPPQMEVFEDAVPECMQSILENALQVPAILVGSRWDLLAVNTRARALFPHLRDFKEGTKQNWFEILFSEPVQKHLGDSWEFHVRRVLAEFRNAVSETLDSAWVIEFIEDMKKNHPKFGVWWRDHDITEKSTFHLELIDPETGAKKTYVRTALRPAENPRLRIVLFNPQN